MPYFEFQRGFSFVCPYLVGGFLDSFIVQMLYKSIVYKNRGL